MSAPADEPPDPAAPAPDSRDSPHHPHPGLPLIALTITMSVLALLLLGGFALYLTWQHPSLAGPIGAAAAAVTVPLTVIGVVVALTKR